MEMMAEMTPMMMPGMNPTGHARMMAARHVKMMPGMQPGEAEGSLHDALRQVMPGMRMMPGAMEPGETPKMMVDTMLVPTIAGRRLVIQAADANHSLCDHDHADV